MLAVVFSAVDMPENQKNKFEALYYRYRRLLYTVIRKTVSSDSDAEDILQNTFIKIAKNIKSIDDIESKETSAFLTVIAKNTAYDFLRSRSCYEEINLEEIESIADEDNTIARLLSDIQYEKIVSCIKSVPSPYMEVMFLHFVKDYSVRYTARLLERKPQTVKMQLVRGKKILVKMLSEVLYD